MWEIRLLVGLERARRDVSLRLGCMTWRKASFPNHDHKVLERHLPLLNLPLPTEHPPWRTS